MFPTLLFLVFGWGLSNTVSIERNLSQIAAEINAMNLPWTAYPPERFENDTLEHYRKMCGSIMKGDPRWVDYLPYKNVTIHEDLPAEFDARTRWSSCNPIIGLIRDQSECGSCWAFGTTEAFNDRYCIHKGETKLLSAGDTNACAQQRGCSGGQPDQVWGWFESSGVCTGGLYGDTSTCKPYDFAPCAHHVTSKKYPACPGSEYPTPSCKSSCTGSGSYTKYRGSSSYKVGGVDSIMSEIMDKGPVAAVFTVFSDFPPYKEGVYSPSSTAQPLGGHCIKLLGWGNDGHCKAISGAASDDWCVTNCCGSPPNCPATLCKCDKPNPGGYYWLAANSWNEEWGDKGFFKIKKGANTCQIEGDVSAGMP